MWGCFIESGRSPLFSEGFRSTAQRPYTSLQVHACVAFDISHTTQRGGGERYVSSVYRLPSRYTRERGVWTVEAATAQGPAPQIKAQNKMQPRVTRRTCPLLSRLSPLLLSLILHSQTAENTILINNHIYYIKQLTLYWTSLLS